MDERTDEGLSDTEKLSGVVHNDTTHQFGIRAVGGGCPCLFSNLTMPDILARIGDGRCPLSEGDRFICLSPTQEKASKVGITMVG